MSNTKPMKVAQTFKLSDYRFSNEGRDPMECGSYRAIKLLEHETKVIERVFEGRIREKLNFDVMQFGFMPGKGTTDAIFTVRQMQDKYGCKRKKLYFAFVDLMKIMNDEDR